ncbi:hypothetical protein C1924_10080 [Stenotrophomonas sp. ESTM1D_MKCIP4_1]|uniref:hypothetical protein n=1 Tax=Stenotrophomonas sp. ESTM1D_MKCIP4_1 TaxID=2072414 RepID=UPI000D53C57B|nr:hypothetical protein [Stenotrophomonas sp. ESTM1D_MKCIP4_1]AWH53503.1 hypothetical protein C1924_10080 [Stenotrophomonas sp. ESTM1D_MKCIP4_1]
MLLPLPSVDARPASAQVETMRILHPREFEILQSHAQAFVSAKAYEGYALETGGTPEAWFQIRHRGRAVLVAENAADGLVIRVPAGAEPLAPDVLRLREHFRIWVVHSGPSVEE